MTALQGRGFMLTRLVLAAAVVISMAGCTFTFPQTVVAHRDDGTTETCRYPSQFVYPGATITKDCSIKRD